MSLNKLAAGVNRWAGTPRWYLWEGGYLLVGRGEGIISAHAHHAIQIVIAVEGEVGIRGKRGDWRMARGVIVRPDVEHSYNPNGALGVMLFVDPESVEGVWLRTSLRDDITLVPDARLTSPVAELRRFVEQPMESMDIRELVRHCVHAL